jgi:hypothetical protein
MNIIKSFNNIEKYLKFLLVIIAVYSQMGFAQTEDIPSNPVENQNGVLHVYIDIGGRDNPERYLRTEIPFVTYVRDPNLAEIHVLIVDQRTGSGGKRFNISFIGKDVYEGQDQTLFYISAQSNSQDEEREGLARIIKMGLMPYVSQTPIADQIDIQYDDDKIKSVQEPVEDSWDYWVFSVNLGGGLRAEESSDSYNISSGLSANRITEDWKFQNRFEYRYEEDNYIDDEESITSFLKQWNASSRIVLSLSSRWSAGLFGQISSTTYRNNRQSWSVAPALEYNFFPWSESERRKFAISYRAGFRSLKYYEITLFDKLADNLYYHALEVKLEMTQPWGKLEFDVDASQYLELKDTYSVRLDIELDFRITNGLEFFLNTRIESIHDQIYLPRGDATRDEILLRQRQIATTYNIWSRVGFRFTFGSIYNNIVNERL